MEHTILERKKRNHRAYLSPDKLDKYLYVSKSNKTDAVEMKG